MKNYIKNITFKDLLSIKYIYILFIPLFYALITFDLLVYGKEVKGNQLRKRKTDKNGVIHTKPKGLVNMFKKWEPITLASNKHTCLDISSMYQNPFS